LGALSKKPGLSRSGRTAKPSICQEPTPAFTLNPSSSSARWGPREYRSIAQSHIHLKSPGSELDQFRSSPVPTSRNAVWKSNFFSSIGLGPPDTVRIQTAFELDERPNVPAIVDVEIKHVPFVEIAIHEALLTPVVIAYLFPNLASFAPQG